MHFPQPNLQKKPNKNDVYYEGNKKNELNELKAYFKTTLYNPDLHIYKKQVVKKIIVYTTQGIDTSRFYPQMVIASGTKDLVQKKLIYFYLSIYSHHNPDFARMAVNTFTKDTNSPNPNIRALSIRHLSNLRFKGRQEYLMPILKQGLNDFSSIVKKACLMGVTKLITQENRKRSQPVRDEELLNILYGLLRDNDSHVVCCAMEAINEIQPEGIAMSKKLTHYLVKNLDSFEEVQLAIVLKYVELYDPKSQQEILEILNKIDTKIKSRNLSIILSICKIYLKYGNYQQIKFISQIHKKIKSALFSFINYDNHETEYVALKEIFYLIKHYNLTIFRADFKKFYLRDSDPTYNKICKIQLLQVNCCKQNFTDIINEFTEYVKEPEIVDTIMEALSSLILRFDLNESKVIIKTLNDLVVNTSSNEYLCNAAIVTIRTFLRKYPNQFKMFENTFYVYVKGITSSSARCSMIEIIGDFGQQIEDSVELIAWSQSIISDELKISLLRSNLKLFFKRPVQMLNIITNLFRQILNDQQTRLHVKDYAAMLYRGLQNDIDAFKKVFLSTRPFSETIGQPFESLESNTLQIVYMKKSQQWLIDKNKYIQLLEQIQYGEEETNNQKQEEQSEQMKIMKKRSLVDLSSSCNKIEPDDIDKEFQMSAEQFQVYWEQYQIGSSITRMVKQTQNINQETLEQLFNLWGVLVIASIQNEQSIKQYLYFKLLKGDIVCMQITFSKEVQTMALMVKTENEELSGFASRYVQDFMKINQIL